MDYPKIVTKSSRSVILVKPKNLIGLEMEVGLINDPKGYQMAWRASDEPFKGKAVLLNQNYHWLIGKAENDCLYLIATIKED